MSDWLTVLKKPVWWAMLILLPFAMALCLVAAKWQYSRHERRSLEQQRADAVASTPAVPLSTALQPDTPPTTAELYTPVTATGSYEPESVLIRNRSLDEERGLWVVSPLRLTNGSVILVLRGWMAATRDNAQQATAPAPPSGTVDVTGVLQLPEPKRGPGILSNGEATSLNTPTLCPDPACYQAYLQLTSSVPADNLTPIPVKGPGLGPHLGYAGQWVIFCLLLPVGYAILLRRDVKEMRAARSVPVG